MNVLAPIIVFDKDPLSIVDPQPISEWSLIITIPTCGYLILELLSGKKPKPFLPITHPEMSRFIISLQDGVNFVIFSLQNMRGGEMFIPKIPSLKVVDLAKAIKKMLSDEDYRLSLAKNGIARVEKNFTWKKLSAQMIDML